MSKILISYRREDSADVTGRIYDRLIKQFGRDSVFKDVDSIPFGVDFRTHLEEQVAKCQVVLAVIGRSWMRSGGALAKFRLEDPRDYVRIEIESALKRGIPVIPVLVRGASIPPPERLPEDIKDLSYRQAISIRSDPDFHRDVDRLTVHLNKQLQLEAQRPTVQQIGSPAMRNDPAVEQKLMALALEYVHIRKYVDWNRDGSRDRKLEAVTTQMRTLAFVAYPLVPKLIESVPENGGKDDRAGERLAAVAMLQALPNPDFLDWLAARLAEEQPFIAYQAAHAILVAARTLEKLHYVKVDNAIKKARIAAEGTEFPDDRIRILDDAANELASR